MGPITGSRSSLPDDFPTPPERKNLYDAPFFRRPGGGTPPAGSAPARGDRVSGETRERTEVPERRLVLPERRRQPLRTGVLIDQVEEAAEPDADGVDVDVRPLPRPQHLEQVEERRDALRADLAAHLAAPVPLPKRGDRRYVRGQRRPAGPGIERRIDPDHREGVVERLFESGHPLARPLRVPVPVVDLAEDPLEEPAQAAHPHPRLILGPHGPDVVPVAVSLQESGDRGRGGLLPFGPRSEEHTSELQSQSNLVCR